MNTHLKRAVAIVGSQEKLAKQIGVTQSHISQLALGKYKNGVRAELAIAIERATDGLVTRHDLRPDIWPVAAE